MLIKILVGILLVGTLLLTLGIFFLQRPLTLRITYRKEGSKNQVLIEWLIFGRAISLVKSPFTSKLEPGKYMKPKIDTKAPEDKDHHNEMKAMFGALKEAIPKTRYYINYLRRHSRRFDIQKLHWKSDVGGSDALDTAMLSGALWAIKATLLGRFYQYMNRKGEKPVIHVNPWYQGKRFNMKLDCIVSLQPGHIIFTGLWHAGIKPKAISRGGEDTHEPSHRRLDANSYGKYQRDG
ncbi:DUF2953 domain-containing protein [Heliorestis acidaminivorans]|uniref:DUF2953 domain-containing protein n=1 Tax=Heliorestis acidaminivorans TaxID=553427 RepID=A0A6I0F2C9_9FIRM|nr:DUF2953 domain-containing protein [Heliorestis acidaminivorans]KAB2952623.1 DUF2953 domain-containing protein [Heliorestis acidaminivorans]